MKALRKNIFREIKNTKSRFISILAIIALSTGFFTGVKASSPSMMETGRQYFEDQNLMDIRLVSTVGFDDDDIRKIKEMDCTVDVMPSYMADLIISQDNIDTTVRVYSLPEKTDTNDRIINEPVVVEGRLPQKSGECVIESYYYNISDYHIGDTIKFNEKIQGKDTADTIKNLEYKITGVVYTPVHITYQRGNTTVGDGSVSFFIMVPSDEFVSERYTNVYVTTTAGGSGYSDLSDEYKELIEAQTEEYENLSKDRIREFNDTTLKDARQELDDAKKEYTDKKAEAEKEISDGIKKLADGEKELNDKLLEAEEKLAQGKKELEESKAKLSDGQKEYADGIEDAKNKLADAQQQYSDGKTAYSKAKLEYDTEIAKAQNQLNAAETEYNTQYSLFYGTTKPQAETRLTLLKTGIDLCNEGIDKAEQEIQKLTERLESPLQIGESIEVSLDTDEKINDQIDSLNEKLKEYRQKLDEYQKQYDEGTKQLAEGEKKLNEAKDQLDDAKSQFEEKKLEGAQKLNEAQIQLDEAQSKLDIGKLEYETAMNTGLLELQAAQTMISEGEKELENGRSELEKQKAAGLQALKEGREKLATGKAEARTKLNEAEIKLKDAEKTIDKLQDAKWYVYDRDSNPGYSNLEEDALRVDNVATVFPIFFLLVAALVCLTTMTRMVEERRTEIGTLKALGYSNLSIAAKYFIYAALAAVAGSVIGAAIGIATLPFIIIDTYSMMYTLPPTKLVIPWDSFVFSAGTGILCTCLVATIACFGELKIRPATLMRPKAPKPGKRILLEHITPLWKHMNFTSKVTARNLFRYKARFLMTVIGVAGCTALIIGGLGLKDSITVIADRQYKEISVYDEIYALSEAGTADEKAYLMSQFHADKRFSETLLVSQNWTTFSYNNNRNKLNLRAIIGENNEQFEKIFILRDRQTHQKIELDNNGIVINERLAEVIGAKLGDTVSFTLNDDPYTAKVTGITENYAGNFMYMTPEFYQRLTGKETEYNIVYTQVAPEAKSNEREIANEWMQNEDIVTVSMLNEQLDSILDMLDSLNVIVFVLVICAGLLAVVVLYNLTNINIAERVREIATIKVLGFYNSETANYIYRENIILTIVGAGVGLPLGKLLATFIVMAIQMDMVMYPQQVNFISYFIGFALTLIFSMLVNFIMYFKMKKISMVESLKSIE